MEEWKDPQQRAEEEDRQRGYSALAVDGGADSRERIEADVRKIGSNTWWIDKVFGWLDRQAAITERHWMKISGANTLANIELNKQREELQRKVDELQAEVDRLEAAGNYDCATCGAKNALEAELDDLKSAVNNLQRKHPYCYDPDDTLDTLNAIGRYIDELKAERDHWRRVASEHAESLRKVWLKDADGKPVRIGDTRYGEDGTGWRVTGFRWGSSHPVQGVDATGRRRDLKPEWLRSEKPDSWERVRSELACLMVNLSMYGSKYAGDPDAELDAILERARGLAGGSE